MRSVRFGSVAIISLAFVACARPGAGPKKSFATPEAAIEHYVKSIAAADADGALQAFAIDDVAAHYDFPAVARYLPTMAPMSFYAPSNHEMYVRLNKLRLSAEAANAVKVFTYALLADVDLEGAPIKQATEAEITAFMTAVNPARLKALKVVRVDAPMNDAARNPEFLANQKRHAGLSGADDQTERVALYEFGGQNYWSGFQLLRYGQRWGISQAFSLLVHAPSLGKTTPAAYEARLK